MTISSNPLTTAAQQAASQLTAQLSGVTGAAAGIVDGVKARLNQLQNVKLAETILTTGPKDELLTVDVLGVSDTNILNSVIGKLAGSAASTLSAFRSNPSNLLGNVVGLISNNGGKFSFDTKALTDRVLSSLGGGEGLLRTMSSGLQNTLTQGLGIDPNLYSQVTGIINGVTTSFQSGNFSDARGIFEIINQITGQSDLAKFFDVGAEANLLSGIINEAIKLGIPDTITLLLEKANSSEAANAALRSNLTTAIEFSDLTTCATIIDTIGSNQVLADVPAMAQQLLAQYRMPTGTTRADYAARYLDLKAVLDAIKPGWGTVDRAGEPATDLSLFSTCSADAVLVLSTHAVKIAPSYTREDLLTSVKGKYPLAII